MTKLFNAFPAVARVVLGIVFFVFGLNGFLHFLPQPPMPASAGVFLGGLAAGGYLFPLLKATELVAGALLLTGFLVPFALTLLAPVLVNILGFHLFLAPAGLALPLVLLAAEVYLAWAHRAAFAPLFRRARVSAPAPSTSKPAVQAAA